MAADEWRVPRPTGVITSRDLARNTSNFLTELMESEQSLMIVRNGLPTAVISSIPDPAWRPRRSVTEIAPGQVAEPTNVGASATTASARTAWRFCAPCESWTQRIGRVSAA
jgi:hypothetical protein